MIGCFSECSCVANGALTRMTREQGRGWAEDWSFSGLIRGTAAFRKGRALPVVSWLVALAVTFSCTCRAKEPEIVVTADQPLRFGTLLVPASGSRTVGARGTVVDAGLYQVGNEPVGPAQFTVTYDRGNESKRSINVVVQVFLAGAQGVRVGSVEAQLSGLESDIAAVSGLPSDALATFTIANCRERRCTRTFRVGARLSLVRAAGGAEVVVPLTALASVLAVY